MFVVHATSGVLGVRYISADWALGFTYPNLSLKGGAKNGRGVVV
jgi:hypothetical protein